MGVFHCQVTGSFLNMLASPPRKFSFLFLKTECYSLGDGESDMFERRQNNKVHPRKILAANNNKLKRNMEDLIYAFFARKQVKNNNKKQTRSPAPNRQFLISLDTWFAMFLLYIPRNYFCKRTSYYHHLPGFSAQWRTVRKSVNRIISRWKMHTKSTLFML